MAGKTKEAAKPRAAPAKATDTAPQSVNEALQQIEKIKTDPATLAAIVDVYERFLTQRDPRKVVETLNALRQARFLDAHAWRVRALALDAKETSEKARHAWQMTAILLVSHGIRGAETASDVTGVWTFIQQDEAAWRSFMATLLDDFCGDSSAWSLREKAALVQFLIHCFSSLDVDAVASESIKIVSLAMWAAALSSSQRALEFADHPKLGRHWKKLFGQQDEQPKDEPPVKKKRKTGTSVKKAVAAPTVSVREKTFVVALLRDFVDLLAENDTKQLKKTDDADDRLRYAALVLALLTDLMSLLPTRRFLEVVLRRQHVVTRLRQSLLVAWCLEARSAFESSALTQQIEHLEQLLHFPIDAHTGKSLTTLQDRKEATARKIQRLQLAAFDTAYRDTAVESLAVVPVSTIVDRTRFREQLHAIAIADRAGLEALGETLGVFADAEEAQALPLETLTECFVEEYSSLENGEAADRWLVLPTELEIWNDSQTQDQLEASDADESSVYGMGRTVLFPVLPLSKLGLQYLSLTDFLERNAQLSRVEAANAVRRDLEQAIRPLDAVRSLARNGETIFRGFSQITAPLQTAFSIMKVEKPAIGETCPASVVAQFDIELDTRHDIATFDRYQHRELVYLVMIRPTKDEAAEAMGFADESADNSGHFAEDFGVLYVRCAELTIVLDESGNPIKHTGDDEASRGKGRKRTLHVALDGAQYKKDLEGGQLGAYEYVNLLVRRDPRTNNFKAVLDAIATSLHNPSRDTPGGTLPVWMYDLFLGYGDPSSAAYEAIAKSKLQAKVSIPLHHTFADAAHAVECCSVDGKHPIQLVDADDQDTPVASKVAAGPFTLVTDVASKSSTLKANRKAEGTDLASGVHRLTKEQAQVVVRGTGEGLTLAMGATGSGKSEALAQLIQNLYQATPASEKILVVARSTDALDKLLGRIGVSPFVDQGCIVRLGGQRGNTDGANFSCQGRVDFLLQRRIDLLKEVDSMAKWMERLDATKYAGLSGSASYSCENALFFYRFYLKALFDETKAVTNVKDAALDGYHTERMGAEAKQVSELHAFAARMEGVFGELHRLQPFELLQLPHQRRDVYLMQHARVIAMTSRHAALQFSKLVDLKLQWTSVVVEDAAEISELDTFIPLALACTTKGSRRHAVKRVVMVGDTTAQPAVQTPSLKKYARFHSSLFGRLLRLGVPHVTLPVLPKPSHPEPPKTKPPPPKTKPTPTKRTTSKK